MSWSGGSRIFQRVVEDIQKLEAGEIPSEEVFATLIDALRDEGWDAGEAEIGFFDEGSSVRKALREVGVFEICGAEHITNPWQCEEEKGHSPTTLHCEGKGYIDRTWTEEETAK